MAVFLGPWRALLAIDSLAPPAGFVFLADRDGALLLDADGAYLMEAL